MSARQQNWPQVRYTQTQLGGTTTPQGVSPGGLDQKTPPLRLQPGALTDVLNFEVAEFGGYSRVQGYERYDGHPSPSSATQTVVQFADNFTSDFTSDFTVGFLVAPTVGLTVLQANTGATGTIAAFSAGTMPYLVLTNVVGTFDFASTITEPGPLALGTAGQITTAIGLRMEAINLAAAADILRASIQALPGGGPVQGVVAMAFAGVDHVYGFRANAGNTQTLLWKASPAGWVAVPLLNLVRFTNGAAAVPMDGDTLTQGGVTATIKRVQWQSGAWAGSAVGRFVVTAPAGGSFAAGAATTTSGTTITLSGPQTAITLAPGGRFQFDKANFSGQALTRRIYGCDGVNPAFEFDGDTLVPIATGLVPDAPSIVHFHKNFLFVTQAASLLYSAAGQPFKWSAVDGAGEIATGDTITGLITLPGSQTTATLSVFMRSNSAFLYGTDPTSFNFVLFNTGIGAAPHSCQNLFDTFFLDDLGVVTLKSTLNYGNFLPSTLTKNILPFIQHERGKLAASSVNREKSQYRLYFTDGYALLLTVLNQQFLGCGLALYPTAMACVDTTNLVTEQEATYAGGIDGHVFQLDVGTSFDGAAIPAYFVTAWDPVKSPRIVKQFRAASIEVQGNTYAEIGYAYQIGYNSAQLVQPTASTLVFNQDALPSWDVFAWDRFTWDGGLLTPSDIDETGSAENIRVTISSGTNFIGAFTVNSIIHHYSMRRGMRV